jgi:hypothetical protein
MMTVADWRKRAHDCMTASRLAADRDGQLGWQALSDAWLKCAEWRDREKLTPKETPVAQPYTPTASPNVARAVENGERLRTRLALGMST